MARHGSAEAISVETGLLCPEAPNLTVETDDAVTYIMTYEIATPST
jgi:hypothetical protein